MIDEAQLTAIHMMRAGGVSAQRIADALGLSVELVQAAIEGRSTQAPTRQGDVY